MATGAFSEANAIDAETKALFIAEKANIEAKIGRTFSTFVPETSKQQVVNGLNIVATINVGGGEVVTATIWKRAAPPSVSVTDATSNATPEQVANLAGGVGAQKPIDDEYRTLAFEQKASIEEKANIGAFAQFVPIGYRTQVVRGINVFLTIRVGPSTVIKATVWKDVAPPGTRTTHVEVIQEAASGEVKESKVLAGGVSDAKVDDETVALVAAQKGAIEAKINKTFTTFEPVSVRKQVVAGTNYFIKIKVGDGKFLDVTIWQKVAPISYEVTDVTEATA